MNIFNVFNILLCCLHLDDLFLNVGNHSDSNIMQHHRSWVQFGQQQQTMPGQLPGALFLVAFQKNITDFLTSGLLIVSMYIFILFSEIGRVLPRKVLWLTILLTNRKLTWRLWGYCTIVTIEQKRCFFCFWALVSVTSIYMGESCSLLTDTLQILWHNRELMNVLTDRLVEKRSVTKKEFFNIVEEYGHLEPMPENIVDIRKAKLSQFQEMMMAGNGSTHGSVGWYSWVPVLLHVIHTDNYILLANSR